MPQKPWTVVANEYLQASLTPVPHELNELDWKQDLSPDSERVAQHISAFANQVGGGYFAFGITRTGGMPGVTRKDADDILDRLGSIVRDSVEPPQRVDHAIETIA